MRFGLVVNCDGDLFNASRYALEHELAWMLAKIGPEDLSRGRGTLTDRVGNIVGAWVLDRHNVLPESPPDLIRAMKDVGA